MFSNRICFAVEGRTDFFKLNILHFKNITTLYIWIRRCHNNSNTKAHSHIYYYTEKKHRSQTGKKKNKTSKKPSEDILTTDRNLLIIFWSFCVQYKSFMQIKSTGKYWTPSEHMKKITSIKSIQIYKQLEKNMHI